MLARRYAYDDLGRITGFAGGSDGRTPRFVLGRAQEGVVWRFRSDLDRSQVVEIGRLAAREQGFPIDGEKAHAPERLAAMLRRIGGDADAGESEGAPPHERRNSDTPSARHEWVSHEARVVGELWIVD